MIDPKARLAAFGLVLALATGAANGGEPALQSEVPIEPPRAAEETPVDTTAVAEAPVAGGAERGLITSLEAGFSYDAYEPLGGTGRWRNSEKASIALSARRGANLALSTRLEAPFTGANLAADDVVKELALSWAPAPIVSLTAGKQILKWGTARVYSSIDGLAPPLDPLDPAGTDRGVTGFRADLIPTWWLSVSALALPTTVHPDQAKVAVRAEIVALDTDISLGGIRSVNAEGTEEPAFFADFARFFDRFGLYGEGQLKKKDDWELSATGGAQVDFPAWLNGTITLLGEYRCKPEEDGTRHMLYAGLSGIPVTRRVTLGASALAAPMAHQAVITGNAAWKVNQTMTASLSYDYLRDWADDGPLEGVFTGKRQKLTASVSAWY